MKNHRKTGMEKEETACRFLLTQGYEVIERNFYSRCGEIDIIARDGQYLVFAEVKYRRSTAFGYQERLLTAENSRRFIRRRNIICFAAACLTGRRDLMW